MKSDLELVNMVPKIVGELRGRVIKSFLDILILSQLKKTSMSGYDLIAFIHKKFDLLVSSGTVYSTLYSLERAGLIKGTFDERRRIYKLTKKGLEDLENIKKANGEIQNLLRKVLPFNAT
jgi:DNA-binding PadR family transcriptional regulator